MHINTLQKHWFPEAILFNRWSSPILKQLLNITCWMYISLYIGHLFVFGRSPVHPIG